MGDRVAVMNEGVLEQVGDPKTVYEAPANVFVAGSSGAPRWVSRRCARNAEMAGSCFRATVRRSSCRQCRDARHATRGDRRRPTRAHGLWHDGSGLVGPIEGRAAYVEMLGRENFIGVESAGDTHFTVHAELDSHVREGEFVRFGLERGRSTSSTRRRTRPSRACDASCGSARPPPCGSAPQLRIGVLEVYADGSG